MAKPDASLRILEATRQEIAANGVRGLRVQNVAKRAGVSLGLVYYHFEDRSGLLTATIDSVNQAVEGRVLRPGTSRGDTEAIIDQLAGEVGDESALRSDSVVWNEIRAIAVFEAELREALATTTRDWEKRFGELLRSLGLGERAVDDTATLLTSLVEGISGRWLSAQLETAEAQRLIRLGAGSILAAATARAGTDERARTAVDRSDSAPNTSVADHLGDTTANPRTNE
ncbi:TetR/AcrR family transcriptional regulator [Brevibacterium casei]|nr:TetR/AcrR family transcriptional regulator [Brevibacterium casei]